MRCSCRNWVRALRNDADGGKAFADRLITAIGLVLLVVTVLTVIFAPLVIRSYAYTFLPFGLEGRLRRTRSPSPATSCRRSSSTACT